MISSDKCHTRTLSLTLTHTDIPQCSARILLSRLGYIENPDLEEEKMTKCKKKNDRVFFSNYSHTHVLFESLSSLMSGRLPKSPVANSSSVILHIQSA